MAVTALLVGAGPAAADLLADVQRQLRPGEVVYAVDEVGVRNDTTWGELKAIFLDFMRRHRP